MFSHSLSLSLPISVALSFSVSVILSPSLSFSFCLSLSLTLSHSLFLSPSVSLFLSASVSSYVSFSLSLSLPPTHTFTLTPSLSLHFPYTVCPIAFSPPTLLSLLTTQASAFTGTANGTAEPNGTVWKRPFTPFDFYHNSVDVFKKRVLLSSFGNSSNILNNCEV